MYGSIQKSKEISFMTAIGYDENDSLLVGYETTQTQNFMEWKLINSQLDNELYESAYSRLRKKMPFIRTEQTVRIKGFFYLQSKCFIEKLFQSVAEF